MEEAILQASSNSSARRLCDLVVQQAQVPQIDLDKLGDSYIRDRRGLRVHERDVWALDVTNDIGIPVVVAVAHWKEGDEEFIEVAAGAHFDPRVAALRAMTELNQFLPSTD